MARRADVTDKELAIVRENVPRFRKELAEELGHKVTQSDLAALAGIAIDTLRGYEQGRRRPDGVEGRRLASALGRKYEDLFDPEPPPRPTRARPQKFKVVVDLHGEPPIELVQRLADVLRDFDPDAAKRVALHARGAKSTKPSRPRRAETLPGAKRPVDLDAVRQVIGKIQAGEKLDWLPGGSMSRELATALGLIEGAGEGGRPTP